MTETVKFLVEAAEDVPKVKWVKEKEIQKLFYFVQDPKSSLGWKVFKKRENADTYWLKLKFKYPGNRIWRFEGDMNAHRRTNIRY